MCLSTTVITDITEEVIHLGNNATVFQAEVLQWEEQHPSLYSLKSKQNDINCDSQAAIMALDNTKIKSKTTIDAVLVC